MSMVSFTLLVELAGNMSMCLKAFLLITYIIWKIFSCSLAPLIKEGALTFLFKKNAYLQLLLISPISIYKSKR